MWCVLLYAMANIKPFLSCVLIFLKINMSYSLSFSEEPQDRIVNFGDTAVLSCVLETSRSSGSLYLYWYKSTSATTETGAPISIGRTFYSDEYRNRYSIAGSGNRFDLTIVNSRVSDSAYYYCSIYDSRDQRYIFSRVARLDIYNRNLVPSCEIEPSTRSLEVGDRITMSCFPSRSQSGNSQQVPAMWKGTTGVRLSRVGRHSGVLTYTFTLREGDLNRPYTCTSSPRFPNVHNCSVTPLARPTITLTPRTATASLGGRAMFSCVTTGTPAYNQFKWVIGYGRKNVLKLTETSGRYIVSTNGESGRLTITDIERSDNNTAVRCQATNTLADKIADQSTIFITPSDEPVIPDVSSTTAIHNGVGALQTKSPSITANGEQRNPPQQDDEPADDSLLLGKKNPSGGVVTGESTMGKPRKSPGGTIIAILISLLVILVLIAIVILYVRKRQGKPTPGVLKRLSVNRPLFLRNFSFSKPKFAQRVSLSEGIQSAQDKIEVVHRRISTLKTRTPTDADKRSSIRDSQIEVLVNPPPPDWQFRNVEDVDKLQRQRMMQRHAPSGAYSHKEMDLLNSLITGSMVKVRTLDPSQENTMAACDVTINEDYYDDDEDADSQFESDFEEDEFDEPMSDSANRAIDPSTPKAPPRRKRRKKKVVSAGNTKETTVEMETKETATSGVKDQSEIYANSEIIMGVAATAADQPIVNSTSADHDVSVESPTYAVVNRKSTLSGPSKIT